LKSEQGCQAFEFIMAGLVISLWNYTKSRVQRLLYKK